MDFESILKSIKGSFSQRKMVDFKEEDLHFEIEPLTAKEEVIIIESCKDVDESEYIEALKRHTLACSIKKINDLDIDKDEIENKSKFVYMKDYLSRWPSALIDTLFEAFTHMSKELEDKIKNNVKFDKFLLSEGMSDEEQKGEFRRIVEKTSEGLTDIEKLKETVDKEIEDADAHREGMTQVAKEEQA